MSAALLARPIEIEAGGHVPADVRLSRWYAETVGYKARYVPTTLPDLLKTDEVIRYEYRDNVPAVPRSEIAAANERLEIQRRPESDLEVCSPRQSVESFARGEGIWRDLDVGVRRRQLDHMVSLVDELYPTFRWFLYDGLLRYAAPMTIFGPKRAVLYIGDMYLVLNGTEHVRALVRDISTILIRVGCGPAIRCGYMAAASWSAELTPRRSRAGQASGDATWQKMKTSRFGRRDVACAGP